MVCALDLRTLVVALDAASLIRNIAVDAAMAPSSTARLPMMAARTAMKTTA